MSVKNYFLPILCCSLIIAIAFIAGCAPVEPEKYEVEVQAEPEEAGEVTGGDTFEKGEKITVKATPKEGYEFTAWEKEGDKVSSSKEYTFTVKNNKNLVANFKETDFEVSKEEDGGAVEKADFPISISRFSQESPQGDYLLYKAAVGLNGPVYGMLDIYKCDPELKDIRDQPNDAKGGLPSSAQGPIYPPRVSPDGSMLAYSTREVVHYEATNKGTIYVLDFSMPINIKHKINLNEDDFASWIIPGWKPNSEGVYYITPNGVMSYSFEEQEPTKILHASELTGLIQKNNGIPSINPHAFNITNDTSQLAYVDYDENCIKVFCLERKTMEKVIELETAIKENRAADFFKFGNQLEFLLDGKCLALRQGLIIDTQTGKKIDFNGKGEILSYAWDGDDKLVVAVGKEYGEGYKLKFKLFDNELNEKETLSTLAPDNNVVVASYDNKLFSEIDGEVYSLRF